LVLVVSYLPRRECYRQVYCPLLLASLLDFRPHHLVWVLRLFRFQAWEAVEVRIKRASHHHQEVVEE
jgi:hypothetical protein